MREILFRGKVIDGEEFIYGDYICGTPIPLIRVTEDDRSAYFGVMPETIGQYTGLHDKNGKKIFEGDILKFSYNEKDENPTFYSIEWKSDRACFGYAETADKMIEVDCLHCEVIGNIHDNIELLGGE